MGCNCGKKKVQPPTNIVATLVQEPTPVAKTPDELHAQQLNEWAIKQNENKEKDGTTEN